MAVLGVWQNMDSRLFGRIKGRLTIFGVGAIFEKCFKKRFGRRFAAIGRSATIEQTATPRIAAESLSQTRDF